MRSKTTAVLASVAIIAAVPLDARPCVHPSVLLAAAPTSSKGMARSASAPYREEALTRKWSPILAKANAQVDGDQCAVAIPTLQTVISGAGRSSHVGATASFVLASAYRAVGRYREGLAEIDALLAAIKTRPDLIKAQPASISPNLAEDAKYLHGMLVWQLEREKHYEDSVKSAKTATDRLLAEADLAVFEYNRDKAVDLVAQAVRTAFKEPNISEKAGIKLSTYFAIYRNDPAIKAMRPQIESVVADRSASPGSRVVALTLLHGITNLATVARACRHILIETNVTPNEAPLHQLAVEYLREMDIRDRAARMLTNKDTLDKLCLDAADAEASGKWDQAADKYQYIADFVRLTSLPNSGPPERYTAEVSRSLPLLRAASKMPSAQQARCEYLGVDTSIGSDWRKSLGSEAWALYALHGVDLAGGSQLMNGSFSYHAYVGDEQNQIRHWRDPLGYQSRANSDLPLVDPAVPGRGVISFLDDNGETYPAGTGPDLYLDLTIPAGSHILSFPLHFSDPYNKNARYRFYLLSRNSTLSRIPNGNDTLDCVCTGLLSVADGAGYARLAVRGPARYTLVIRRLNSLNANLPALFLDPDPRMLPPDKLAWDFSADELEQAGVSGDAKGAVGQLVSELTAAESAASQANGNASDLSGIESDARKAEADPGLTALQQSIAAWVGWRASERSLLHRGDANNAFADYLKRRIASWKSDMVVPKLRTLAATYQAEGKPGYAEATEAAAWDISIKNAVNAPSSTSAKVVTTAATADSSASVDPKVAVVANLWRDESLPFTAPQTCRLWEGEGGAEPQPLDLSFDAAFTAQMASQATEYLLAPATAGSHIEFDSAQAVAARAWVDELAKSMKLSLDTISGEDGQAGGSVQQPIGCIVYAAAALPLLEAGPKDSPSLLRPDQMELLARALMVRTMFPVEEHVGDIKQATTILQQIKAHDASYARVGQVEKLLDALHP